MVRIRPISTELEAMQWNGTGQSLAEIKKWSQGAVFRDGTEVYLKDGGVREPMSGSDWVVRDHLGRYIRIEEETFREAYEVIE